MRLSRLWIVITRPDGLVDALAVAAMCRAQFAECRLLYEESSWWRRTRWDEYRGVFDGIDAFSKVTTCRGLRDLPRMYRALVQRQRRLRTLGIAPEDVIVCLSGIMGLANALASAYPNVPKVLAVTRKKYDDSHRAPDRLRYRHTTSSWLQYHLLEPLAGVERTIQLKPRRNLGGDGVRISRLERSLEEVFQALVLLSNAGNELPPAAGPNVVPAPFPRLSDFAPLLPQSLETPPSRETGQLETHQKAVFFGTPFLLVRNLPPEQYAEILNRCLDYLRRHYGNRCQLAYRPHPAETTEREHLRLEGFAFENDQEVAQLYFLRHFAALEAVYSVSSTVSRVALNYGLNGYALWRCFPFAASAAEYFATLMGEAPPEFDIRSLDEAPRAYAAPLPAGETPGGGRFAAALRRAIEIAAGASTALSAEKAIAPGGENAR